MLDPSSLLLAACANCTPASPNLSDLPTPPCDQIQEPVLTAQSDVTASTCVSQPETDAAFMMASSAQTSNLSPSFSATESYAAAGRLSRIGQLHQTLKTATCLNDWDTAIDAASQLIGSYGLTDASRREFIQFRYDLQNWQAENTPMAVADCGNRWAAVGSALPTNQRIAATHSSNFSAATLAQTHRTNIEQHHQDLKAAACLNDWETAIDAASQLIGSFGLTDASRREFIQFRYHLQNWSAEDAEIAIAHCNRSIALAEIAP